MCEVLRNHGHRIVGMTTGKGISEEKEDVLAEMEFNLGREAQAKATRCTRCHSKQLTVITGKAVTVEGEKEQRELHTFCKGC